MRSNLVWFHRIPLNVKIKSSTKSTFKFNQIFKITKTSWFNFFILLIKPKKKNLIKYINYDFEIHDINKMTAVNILPINKNTACEIIHLLTKKSHNSLRI